MRKNIKFTAINRNFRPKNRDFFSHISIQVFKSQSVLNICGQHLDGRHEQFLDDIMDTLKSQTSEIFLEKNSGSVPDDALFDQDDVVENVKTESDDPDTMTDMEIVDMLAKKSKLELMDPKLAPYVAKIKNSPELLKALQLRARKIFHS